MLDQMDSQEMLELQDSQVLMELDSPELMAFLVHQDNPE